MTYFALLFGVNWKLVLVAVAGSAIGAISCQSIRKRTVLVVVR